MKTYFALTDIHGFYDITLKTLEKNGFQKDNSDHYLIVCGDIFDRGEKPVLLYKFLLSLGERFIFIRGNHEDLFQDCLTQFNCAFSSIDNHHFRNGTVETIKEFYYYHLTEQVSQWIDLKSINYFELGNTIFVHGWIPIFWVTKNNKVIFQDEWNDNQKWKQARWLNGMEEWHYNNSIPNKTIVCGHWHCSWGWLHLRKELKEFPNKNQKNWEKSFEPFVDNGIIAFDACTAYSGLMNCLKFDENGNLI